MLFSNALFGSLNRLATNVIYAAAFTSGSGAFSPVLATLGAVAGDLVLAYPIGNYSMQVGATAMGVLAGFRFKFLVTGDLSQTVNSVPGSTQGDFIMIIVRGCTSIASVVTANSGGTGTISTPGFVKNANHTGIIGMTIGANSTNTVRTILTPTPWIMDVASTRAVTTQQASMWHRFTPSYVNNTPITWTAFSNTDAITILELRR